MPLAILFLELPLWTQVRRANTYTLAAANLNTVPGVAGAVMATLRRWFVLRSDFLPNPAFAVLTFVVLFVPLLILMGVCPLYSRSFHANHLFARTVKRPDHRAQ